jgi:hypothetical protein
MKNEFKLITNFDTTRYRCGLGAGDRIRLKVDIIVKDHRGKVTGTVHRANEVWTVLPGSSCDPKVVRLRQPNGSCHFWDDDESIFQKFEVIPY